MQIDRAALEQRLEALQAAHRALTAESLRNCEKLRVIELQNSRAADVVEREEDQLANGLLRRIDSVRKDKESLLRDLKEEEGMKAEREKKLAKLKMTSKSLMSVLKAEEDGLRHKLLAQLSAEQRRRQLLEKKVACESTTLQELTQAVKTLRGGDDPVATTSTSPSTLGSSGAPTPNKAAQSGGSDAEGQPPRSAAAVAADRRGVVTDSAMLQHLQREIGTVQCLRAEAQERIKRYSKKRLDLEQRTAEAVAARQVQRDSVDWMRTELARTHELSANSEVMAEWAADREFFMSVRGRHQRTSSVASSRSTDTSQLESTPRVLHGGSFR